MKKVLFPIGCTALLLLSGCSELQRVAQQLPQEVMQNYSGDISEGLKQALKQGVDVQVSKLTEKNGFYKDQLVKILLPKELRDVEKGLRSVGLGNLADRGIEKMNRAAELAVNEATPIFVGAIKEMTINDAKHILMGADDAATRYLASKTERKLYTKFEPIVKQSFQKVGADAIWKDIITEYNQLPFTKKVNPNLVDYVTNEALKGVYKKIEIEEKRIRTQVSARKTALLQRVFAMQDKK